MASPISRICSSAYVGDTYAPSHEIAKLRLSSCLSCSHVRKPRKRSLNGLLDARSRRVSRLSEISLNRVVTVSCSINDSSASASSSSSSSSNSHSDGSQLRDGHWQDVLPAMWDLEQLKAAAARIGDSIRDILSTASRRWQTYLDSHRKLMFDSAEEYVEPTTKPIEQEEWDWEQWREYFVQVEQQEKVATNLEFQLENAIDEEDFKDAARLKGALGEASSNDPVSQVLTDLKKALEDESYETATRLRDEAAAGLLGWWVGLAKGENDPYGRIINISSSYGRFVARGYTARQLASASSGTPLFEVFVRKDHEGYRQQAVYLQQGGTGESSLGSPTSMDVNIDVNIMDIAEDGKEIKAKEKESLGDEKARHGDLDDGLNGIINFIKDRIPDVKLKVFRVIAQNGEDIPKIVEQILEEVEPREGDGVKGKKENDGLTEEVLQEAKDKVDGAETVQELQKEIPIRLIVGGTLQNAADDKLSKVPTRRQARIETRGRDSFLFHIEEVAEQPVPADKELFTRPRLPTATTQAPKMELPPEISRVVSNLDKIPVKVSKDMGELLKLAISQVHRRRGLSKCTSFERIKLSDSNTDMTGLYIGAFGPYTSELVQLKQKYGHWMEEMDTSYIKEKLEFFEYVEAVKLTGDLNVPAGQVTFRAKISKDGRLPHRGIYPEELGVTARYKGQGRLAEPGFKNPQWVDGELLLLDGKGFGHFNGAELGFVYSVPERHFLVLFNRLKLQAE